MENDKFEKILYKQLQEEYYTAKELQYGNKVGTFLSPYEYNLYIKYKEDKASFSNSDVIQLPLKSFNSKCLYYCNSVDLKSLISINNTLLDTNSYFLTRFSKNFIESRIYSEIEGTLNVENVPTTRRRIKELLEDDAPIENKNDIVIKNMKYGIDFLNQLPAFNKENLFKLYSLLSKDCLDEEDKLKPGDYYRYDSVEISRYHGCPHTFIEECMNSLFEFVSSALNEKERDTILLTLLPHICHYYMIYIHPYFDYNGRTARMVSYWVYLLTGSNAFPPIISEAINQTKNKYFLAIEYSRDSHNDLTYFLKYLFSVSNDYVITYQNLEHLEKIAKAKGYIITETELNYMKKIFISYEGPFVYSDFLKIAKIEMSKQGALKVLNKFIEYGFLKELESKTKSKIFDIDEKNILYKLKNFGYKVK